MEMNAKLRNEGLRNQKIKNEVVEVDERSQDFMKKQVAYLF